MKMRLIDADALKERAIRVSTVKEMGNKAHCYMKAVGTHEIDKAPTVDAVSRCVVDQIRWERDVAIVQLEEHGIPFCGKAPDVVKVVRCKDCIWFSKTGYDEDNTHEDDLNLHMGHCSVFRTGTQACRFCSYGERREGE